MTQLTKATSIDDSMHTLNRRSWFNAMSGIAMSGLSWQLPIAMSAEREPITFAVVTDTHLGYRDKDAAEKQWEKTAAELSQSSAKFILHLGDVVDGQRIEQYAKYIRIRDQIGKPVYEIPGNHDPVAAFAEHLRKDIDTVVDHSWLRCVLLNNSHTDSHDGFFETEQLEWLSQQCDTAKQDNRLLLVACHVPVHSNAHPDRGWYVKPADGQARFYDILKSHQERVIATLHGHFHNGLRGWDDRKPIFEISFPSALYNQDRRLEAQQAPGFNPVEFRPGYSLVTVGEGRLSIRYRATGVDAQIEKTLQLS